ncbi:MAG: glycosyltransferase family 4 protein [Thaumarchaeota archaeon]|nr:glycosyltransferase family 4 protein [Nitrososphaerota archaeon]
MRICYVAPDVAVPHYRGSSTHVYEVAKNLSKLGHEVHVVARRVDSGQAKKESLDGMTIHRFQRGIVFSSRRSSFVNSEAKGSYRGDTPSIVWKSYETYLKTIFPLYIAIEVTRLVRESSIDIIFERETAFGAGAMGSMLTGRPLILEVIGNRVSNLQARRSSKIIAYSRGMFEGTPEAGKVETVSGAVDTDMFSPDPTGRATVRRLYSLDSPVIGYVGTFQEWHGLAELIRAAGGLLERHPDAKFLMVGPYYKETQAKVEAAGLGRSFVFTGPIAYVDVPKYINAADVLVAPYNPDKIESTEQVRKHGLGAPLKVYEYMAVGKPVITTDVKPISDPVEDGVTGYLVPPGDSDALGSALERILDNPAASGEMGAAARESMVANYSWGLLARQLSDIFEGVLRRSVAQN